MDNPILLHLHPTAQILAAELDLSGIPCRCTDAARQSFRGVRIFSGGAVHDDILYILEPEKSPGFPGNGRCICAKSVPGCVILCPQADTGLLLDRLLEIFLKFQDMEQRLDDLVHRGADTTALCTLGEKILENPVCIHDDWFILTAASPGTAPLFPAERAAGQPFIPRQIVEDFRFDPDYQQTFAHRTTQFWSSFPDSQNCLYVNLWQGEVYRGRLLVLLHNREARPADYLIAQCLAQRVGILLRQCNPGTDSALRSMDRTVAALLHGDQIPEHDGALLAKTLNWAESDKLVCIRIQSQQPGRTVVLEHTLHSDLFRTFPGSYILLDSLEQCVIVNITRNPASLPQLRHLLAPLCRDYCQYAGISNPISGIRELNVAYYQAGVALNRTFRLQSEKWILCFCECAMAHILKSIPHPLSPSHLVAPELQILQEYDRDKGTQYYETFREYLLQERDIPRTSEKLIIHRSTLLYRLKKIQALIQTDLECPWQRLYLTLSLWILERDNR